MLTKQSELSNEENATKHENTIIKILQMRENLEKMTENEVIKIIEVKAGEIITIKKTKKKKKGKIRERMHMKHKAMKRKSC
jgi:hypothetical protein